MMVDDALFGPAFPELGWVPAPRYLMRRSRIVEFVRELPPGRLLEAGPGAGTLLLEFAKRGFECEALELSNEARSLAGRVIAASGQPVRIHERAQDGWQGAFDYMFAFEVLEHIEDDVGALASWRSWLRPGGTLLLSVPARMKLWSSRDEWAGHFRRYEREQLLQLLKVSGFEVVSFECYGFPLTSVTDAINAKLCRKRILRRQDAQQDERRMNSDRSGIDRRIELRVYPLLKSWPGRLAMRMAITLQRLFLERDWGSGYVLRARKP